MPDISEQVCRALAESEFDKGFSAGLSHATEEALRIVASHIDRLPSGKQQPTRAALVNLEASLRSILVAQRKYGTDIFISAS